MRAVVFGRSFRCSTTLKTSRRGGTALARSTSAAQALSDAAAAASRPVAALGLFTRQHASACQPLHDLPRHMFARGASWSTDGLKDDDEELVTVSKLRLHELMDAEMSYLASVPARPVSMREVLDCQEPDRLARFIQMEVPIRFAARVSSIETLTGWRHIPELAKVHGMMNRWYRNLRLVRKSSTKEGFQGFTKCIKEIREEGGEMVSTIASGVHKLRLQGGGKSGAYDDDFLNKWMDNFLLSRIGTNMLLDQYRACAKKEDGGLGRATGIIDMSCNATMVCSKAADIARLLCHKHTGKKPQVIVENYKAGMTGVQPDAQCVFSYIPGHLAYIVIELLKNSLHATVKVVDGNDECIKRRPVHLMVCHDEQRVAIRVSDRAGGIPFDVGDRVWSYFYGAAVASQNGVGPQPATALAGYGVGLPISRLRARYLGGRLDVTTYPGYGTDAHLLLPRILTDQVEEMPHGSREIGGAGHSWELPGGVRGTVTAWDVARWR